MRFTTAWANVHTQNITLKIVVLALAVCSVILTFSTVTLSLKDPLVIERGCYSKAVSASATKHSQKDIEAFVTEAIPKRFDTDATDFKSYLSSDENSFRMKEQQELMKNGVSQKVVVKSVKMDGTNAIVDAARLIFMGNKASAAFFPLKLSLSATGFSASNPYGLVLERVSEAKEGNPNEKK